MRARENKYYLLKLTSSYDVFVLKVKKNALLAKTVKFNKGFLILTGKRGGRERSLLAYEEPGRAKVNRANTFIYIYIIYIYSWISALFFFGSPSLSLFICLCNVWSLVILPPVTCLAFLLRHFFQLLIDCCSLYIFVEKHFDRKLKQLVIREYT